MALYSYVYDPPRPDIDDPPGPNINDPPRYCERCPPKASRVYLHFTLNALKRDYGHYSAVCEYNHLLYVYPLDVVPRHDDYFDENSSAWNDSMPDELNATLLCTFPAGCPSSNISRHCTKDMCAEHCRESGGCAYSRHRAVVPVLATLIDLVPDPALGLPDEEAYPTFHSEQYTRAAREDATRRAQLALIHIASPSPSPAPRTNTVVVYLWTDNVTPAVIEIEELLEPEHWMRYGQQDRYEIYDPFGRHWANVAPDHVHYIWDENDPILVRDRDIVGIDQATIIKNIFGHDAEASSSSGDEEGEVGDDSDEKDVAVDEGDEGSEEHATATKRARSKSAEEQPMPKRPILFINTRVSAVVGASTSATTPALTTSSSLSSPA